LTQRVEVTQFYTSIFFGSSGMGGVTLCNEFLF